MENTVVHARLKILLPLVVLLFWPTISNSGDAAKNRNSQAKIDSKVICGFQSIAFGTDYDTVLELLQKEYSEKVLDDRERDYIWINNFDLGGKQVTVTFFFDHCQKFYGFNFESERKSAEEFDTEVYQDGYYLSEVFKKRFGKPQKHFKPGFLNVRYGYTAYLCKWNHKELEIYTGFETYEAEYSAVGYVRSKKMVQEHQKETKKKKARDVGEAVKTF